MTIEQKHIIEHRIREWRKLDVATRERAWHDAIVDLAANSLAMEAEPISKAWIQKTKASRI
jgi:hypothetical protein